MRFISRLLKNKKAPEVAGRSGRKVGLLSAAIMLILLMSWPAQGEYSELPMGPDKKLAAIIIKKDFKETKKRKKRPCCALGIAYTSGPGYVILDSICRYKKKTVFRLRTRGIASVCTYPPATFLFDDKGKKYRMIGHTGLPDCQSGLARSKNVRFTWQFQPLRKSSKTFTLIEEVDPVTSGFSHWAWRKIKMTHCRFK